MKTETPEPYGAQALNVQSVSFHFQECRSKHEAETMNDNNEVTNLILGELEIVTFINRNPEKERISA